MWRMKLGGSHERKVLSPGKALDNFRAAKARFDDMCCLRGADQKEIMGARKDFFQAAEVLAEVAQSKNLEKKYFLAIEWYKTNIRMSILAVKISDYFLVPSALLISLASTGSDAKEAALKGLIVVALAFALRIFGNRTENGIIIALREKLGLIRDAINASALQNHGG